MHRAARGIDILVNAGHAPKFVEFIDAKYAAAKRTLATCPGY
jgi:hypothetical protein